MVRDLKDYLPFAQSGVYSTETTLGPMDPIAANTQKLVQRIEELEDLVVELKTKQSVGEIVELKQLIAQLQIEAKSQDEKIATLTKQRVNSKDLF